jgi:2-C-methyl-D-erythritol 2,4-cyclodiphosphate synthase
VVHSIVDGIFQAAELGDLGTHFGSDLPELEGVNSRMFLDHALDLAGKKGFAVSSIAVQVVTENPKINPRRKEAEELLSSWIGAPVSVSATSTDGLGFTGRGEGLVSIATVTLYSRARL